MNNIETTQTSTNKNINRLKKVARTGAAMAALAIPATATAQTPNHHPAGHGREKIHRLIAQEELNLSQDIGSGVPVSFINAIAYFRHGDRKPIMKPLTVLIPDGNKVIPLIGAIEDKGGSTGPDVTLYPYNDKNITFEPDPTSSIEGEPVQEVVFPGTGKVAGFDTSNPVNPATGDQYLESTGEPSIIAYEENLKPF